MYCDELFSLSGKKAMVTGGSGDLGSAMAEALAGCGAEVCVIGRTGKVNATAEKLREKGFAAHAVIADLGKREELERSFGQALALLGNRIDILVNSAGIQRRHRSEEFPMKDWDRVIEVNLTATFRYCQLAGVEMIRQGGGKIINVASMMSFFGGFTVPAYAASKGGVAQLTKAFSNEWAAKGIQVNAIAPGYMDTQMNVQLINDPVRNAEILKRIPAGRWGTGEDMKGIAVFLASKTSDYITGAVIPVDGGYLGR